MKIKLTPQRSDYSQLYSATGDVLSVTINDVTDTFDFSSLENGDQATDIMTTLPINPIINATRVNGDIEVAMISFYGIDADDIEKNFREVTL
jgi:hypothetical protein